MKNTMKNTLRKSAKVIKVGALVVGLISIAQAASATDYLNASAPITYKMANQSTPTSGFDQTHINKALAPHQIVGNPYTVYGTTYTPKHQHDYDMVGTASWYGDRFHGKKTVSGEAFNKNEFTAAHKTLPLNSLITVTNLQTGQNVTVRINDRGPFVGERIVDLSEAAAKAIGMGSTGLGTVRVQYAGPAKSKTAMMAMPQTQIVPNFGNQVAGLQLNLPYQQVAIPESYMPHAGGNDQTVTMTIKGPIHMAKDSVDAPKARLIKAVNRTTYKSKK